MAIDLFHITYIFSFSFLLSPTRLLFFPSITDKTFVLSFYHRQDFCSFLLSPTRLLLHLTIWTTRLVFCKKQELLTTRGHLGSPPVLGSSVFAELFNFLCCALCFACLRLVMTRNFKQLKLLPISIKSISIK